MEPTVIEETTRTTRIKNFLNRHSTAIAVTATATACVVINRIALKQHDEFLKERGLYDEFYTPEED